MTAEAAKEEGEAGSANVRRAVLEVTRAVSLTPWAGDVTFNAASPGATPSAQKKGSNPVPYGTEVHATRYQYGIALTSAPAARWPRSACPKRSARIGSRNAIRSACSRRIATAPPCTSSPRADTSAAVTIPSSSGHAKDRRRSIRSAASIPCCCTASPRCPRRRCASASSTASSFTG